MKRGRPPVAEEAKAAWAHERALLDLRALARQLGVTQPAVSKWEHVPADRLEAVVRLTGVPRERLRPDLHPPAPDPWANL